MTGLFVAVTDERKPEQLAAVISHMDKVTQEWTMRAARGECGWICADCCVSFPEGMPDACEHSHESCTAIIERDKAAAYGVKEGGDGQ